MDKVFELKCYDRLDSIDATKVFTIFVVCDNSQQAINKVITPDTITVEIVSVNPCLILK